MAIDIAIQAGLGRFFGAKFRSGVLYRIHEQTGDRAALEESLKQYRAARAAWAELANRAKGVYVSDITVGERPQLRGHWLDRLPAMDADIAAGREETRTGQARPDGEPRNWPAAIQEASAGRAVRRLPAATLRPRSRSARANRWKSRSPSRSSPPRFGRLYYRHVTHAERYQAVEMAATGNRYRAVVPATYTDSPYPLQYYFELGQGPDSATLYPGFGADLVNQPYFVVGSGRRSGSPAV